MNESKEFFAILLKIGYDKFSFVEVKENGKVHWLPKYNIPWRAKIGDIIHIKNMSYDQNMQTMVEVNSTEFCMGCETLQKKWSINCSGFSKATGCKCKLCGFEWYSDSSGKTYKILGEKIRTSEGYWSSGKNFTEEIKRVLNLVNEQRNVLGLESIVQLRNTTYHDYIDQ